MSMAYQVMQFLLVGGALVSGGFFWGRRAGSKTAAAGARQVAGGAGFRQDKSFQDGFRAGHLQGWRDATTRGSAEGAGSGAAPQEASQVAPGELGQDGFVFHPQTIDSLSDTSHSGSPLVSELDRPWIPLTGPIRQHAPAAPPSRAAQSSALAPPSHETTLPPQPSAAPKRFVPPQAPQWSTPQESAEERQARKDKRDQQNINITLYVASLLLVAAGALFLGTNLPTLLKFLGVCGITALFYSAGLVLHGRVPRLRPAAVAFAGTGLALIPVVGLALYNFALQDGPIAWLATSMLGLVAYSFAAVRLESRVLAYVSLTFVVSSTWSGVSVLGGALVWYFTAMIGLAVLLTALTALRPRWLPPLYLRPLMQLHPLVVPAVAVSVTVVPLLFTKAEYSLVMFLCGLYLATVAATPGRFRLLNFYGARAALTAAGVVGVWQWTDRPSTVALLAAGLLALQAVGVSFARRWMTRWLGGHPGRWSKDAAVTFAAQLLASWAWVIWSHFEAGNGRSALSFWLPLLATLLIGMALAVRLRGLAEWMPAATITAAASLGQILGAWQLSGFLMVTGLFWLVRAKRPGTGRPYFVLAARIAGTLVVPLAAFALMDGSSHRVVGALLALNFALVVQQLLSAGLLRDGIPTLAPNLTLAGSTGAGLMALIAMPFYDETPGNAVTGTAALVQLGAAVFIGWILLLDRTMRDGGSGARGEQWSPTVGELLPPGVSLVVVPLAFGTVSLASGNLTLLLAAAYFIVGAGSLSAGAHRWVYWWLARASLTVLALTGFEQLREVTGPLIVADQVITSPLIALLVLAPQLVFPLAAARCSTQPALQAGAIAADVTVVLGLQSVAVMLLGRSMDNPGWPGTVAIPVLALGATCSGFVLRGYPLASSLAPLAFVFVLVVRGGELLDLELVLAIYSVYSAAMVIKAEAIWTKGAHFLGMRVLSAALVVVVAYDISRSALAVSVSLALVLAAQHALGWLVTNRPWQVPFQRATLWVTLGAQALLPFQEILSGRLSSSQDAGSLRWVVLLELGLLLASALFASRFFNARGSLYLTVYATVFGVLALGPSLQSGAQREQEGVFLASPVLTHNSVALMLLALALAGTASGIFVRRRPVGAGEAGRNRASEGSAQVRPNIENPLWLVASGAPALTAFVVSPSAEDWITGLCILVLSIVCFVASHLERLAVLYPPAAVAALAGATMIAFGLVSIGDDPWRTYLPWAAGCGVAAAAMYLARWIGSRRLAADPLRRCSLAGGGIAGFAFVAALGLGEDATAGMAAALVAAVSIACWLEAPARLRRVTAELGALAVTASLQRAVLFTGGPGQGPDPFWSAQWFVVLAALLAVPRYIAGQTGPARVILGAGAALLSVSGIAIVFGGAPGQQLWVLILLVILLFTAAALNERLFVWWGAAGVTLCLMWAMRQYTFALLALIGVALIIFAVWRLNRTKTPDSDAAHPPLPSGTRERALHGQGPVE